MYSTFNNDIVACMVKSNPELESVIQAIVADNKKATSMLVHELRNPLSLLKGTIQYIETKHPDAKEFKYWDQIQDLINDMDRIMADASLLNTFNLIHKEETNLITLVESLINSFMPQALTKGVELSCSVEPLGVPSFTSFSCDAVKIKQVLINLIKNAFEATVPGDFIHIDLNYIPEDYSTPSKLSIAISNNGQPIPEEVLENIFVPFVTYKKGGTGVGLALVKRVVDLHYGSVNVESDEKLTSFTIQLPV
ncbi:MAG TPA: HAMP domain-containing sensor histidine kinase [Mobilitalea sp.]|nr:HAMP domain-containing sensor histidine kinase [Mobilitalea sp.]